MSKKIYVSKIIERLSEFAGLSYLAQKEIAEALVVSANQVSNIFVGRSNLTKAQIELLKLKFNLNPDWLLHGTQPMFLEKEKQDLPKTALTPVIAYIPAGYWITWNNSFNPAKGDYYISLPKMENPNLYGIFVYGDSMEPTLYEGDILIIDPDKPFKKGIALVRHNKKYCIRNVFKISDKKYLLISHNPKYDDEEITADNYTKLFVPIKVVSMRDI